MEANTQLPVSRSAADVNWRLFIAFRVLFNARFYYPVLSILFLAYGLTVAQFALLNFAWSISIMCFDLPAGALADHLGRRPLIIAAAVFMVIEMCLLAFVPLGHPTLLFCFFLANRIISGMAEACASGADEALVFDSLAEQGRSEEWSKVLDLVMRWQSAGFILAMLVGSVVYDPVSMQRVADALGLHVHLTQQITMRFPIYLNVLTALATLVVAWRLREPVRHISHQETPSNPLKVIAIAGHWLWLKPFAMVVIVAGFLHDSVIRLFMTYESNYFRIIEIPTKWFGALGAAMAVVGFFLSPVVRGLAERKSSNFNFGILVILTLAGLAGVAMHIPLWGALFIVPLGIAMYFVNFFVSFYLNSLAEPGNRATVLSFKGLAFNLGYSLTGLLFAGLFHVIQNNHHGLSEDTIFARAIFWIPVYFAGTIVLLALVTSFMGKKARQ